MAFNFQAGYADDVGVESEEVELLVKRFGSNVPMGKPGEVFYVDDEMGWSWWRNLQEYAVLELGKDHCRQICATDAWHAVYIDSDIERELIGTPKPESAEEPRRVRSVELNSGGIVSRILGLFGVKRQTDEAQARAVMDFAIHDMVKKYGARPGERGVLQVGNVRKLKAELELLLAKLKIEPTEEAVEAVRQRYMKDERFDDDPHIQCLCHAWLTARYAVESGSPMWLIK